MKDEKLARFAVCKKTKNINKRNNQIWYYHFGGDGTGLTTASPLLACGF
jgi:hypothetical protein